MSAIAITVGSTPVGDVMTPDPVFVGIDCPLTEIAELLDFYSISGLPVVDWSGILVGVVSQTDLVRVEATEDLSSLPRLTARDLMSSPAVTVRLTSTLEEAARLMNDQKIHRLVVIDAADEPIGVLSSSDLVRAIAQEPDGTDAAHTRAELAIELS